MITAPQTIALAKLLAPEDITPGMFVTALYEINSVVVQSSQACGTTAEGTTDFRARKPAEDAGTPRRVIGVCLPFVMVETSTGAVRTFDTRQVELARLSDRFGSEFFARKSRELRK